jgi:hypothetical protein
MLASFVEVMIGGYFSKNMTVHLPRIYYWEGIPVRAWSTNQSHNSVTQKNLTAWSGNQTSFL